MDVDQYLRSYFDVIRISNCRYRLVGDVEHFNQHWNDGGGLKACEC